MTGSYRIAPVAQQDLDDIWDYVAERNPSAATKLLSKFERVFWLIGENPKMGRTREDLLPDLRSVAVDRYVIFYRLIDDEDLVVEIARVLHGARDMASLFKNNS